MKPKPLSSLNHLTVPVAIDLPSGSRALRTGECFKSDDAVTRGTVFVEQRSTVRLRSLASFLGNRQRRAFIGEAESRAIGRGRETTTSGARHRAGDPDD